MSTEEFFKVVLVGGTDVGKSTILLRYVHDTFTPATIPTIGIDFKKKTVVLEGKRIKLQIWDTAGREEFRTITPKLYCGANGIILVYDITRLESFVRVTEWLQDIEKTTSDVERLLIGNKCDREERRVVESERGEQLARSQGIPFMETSAKTNHNINEAFEQLARLMLRKVSSNKSDKWGYVDLNIPQQDEHEGRIALLKRWSMESASRYGGLPIIQFLKKSNHKLHGWWNGLGTRLMIV